ncbi:MAG: Flp pilus assembly complex ATPase component TadA [Phycisphaeraceae bacterium]|nr:Flp pilus assembly complex ATPase component TadA [Phycisphaeraceae bacterium]
MTSIEVIPGQPTPQTEAVADVPIPFVGDLSGYDAYDRFLRQIPIVYARRHQLVLLLDQADDSPPVLVVVDPRTSGDAIDAVQRLVTPQLLIVKSSEAQVLAAINRVYESRDGHTERLLDEMEDADLDTQLNALRGAVAAGEVAIDDLLEADSRAPVIRLVNLLLLEAVKLGASDLHLQPYADRVVARMRLDGVLFDLHTLPKRLQDEAVSRIKVIGQMDIAEKRLPQDGRATVQLGEKVIDLRISTVPASHGERAVIRLLDKSARLFTPHELGMPQEALGRFRELIHMEHGLILLTGPTGSGKTTTLYAALQEIHSAERNVITLEDPIEYELPGVSQIQINNKKGMTFAGGLRSVLRQDPDIIMVGEIRDRETAVMAIQSALTGHLVFSTLHTNDAASAVTRLLDLGVEPYLVASSLVGVLAQRLVRRVCKSCGTEAPIPNEARRSLGLIHDGPSTCYQGKGCEACRGSGYKGRQGLFELLTLSETTRELIQQRATAGQIKDQAIQSGMTTLRDDGLQKIRDHVTTPDEVLRVTTRSATATADGNEISNTKETG